MKAKLIKSVVFLSLTLMLFISTLYAWYISNTTVSAGDISGSVMEAEGGGLEITGSSLIEDFNLIYPYKAITFKMRANKSITKIIIDFDVTSSSEEVYKSLYKNNPQYTYGKYMYVKNGHSYNYEVNGNNRIDLLWQLSKENNIEDFFTGELNLNGNISTLNTENNKKCFTNLNIASGDEFSLNVILGDKKTEKYPGLKGDGYKIEASNSNCFMLGMKIKLIFTVEGASLWKRKK